MGEIDGLLHNNQEYAETFDQQLLGKAPARRVAVLTCMDARMDPSQFLGLNLGDAHVIRNAGGRASSDAIRSLIISSWLLGTVEYMVIHHTYCGMAAGSEQEVQGMLAAASGTDVSGLELLTFTDLEESVRDDIRAIRKSPFIPIDVEIRGFVYDVKTGRLHPVE